jgi:hypothetical protein
VRRLLSLILLVAVPSLSAQSVRGRVVDADRHTALSGALVELRDSAGLPLQRMLTTPSGAFAFMVRYPGHYGIRVAAIGFVPTAPRAIAVPDAGINVPDIVLERSVFRLPDLLSAAKSRACGVAELKEGVFAGVLESARNAMQVVDAAFDKGGLGFRVRIIVASTLVGSETVADTSTTSLTSWPLESADLDSLRTGGFARDPTTVEKPGMIYYGPDARVLFADWFLEGHCYTLVVDRKGSATDSVHIRFAPREKSDRVDLSGEMVFDRETMSLRRLTFRHVNLPKGMDEGMAGGSVMFDRWPSGLWIPVAWSIWGPIERAIFIPAQPIVGLPRSSKGQIRRAIAGMATLSGRVIEVTGN